MCAFAVHTGESHWEQRDYSRLAVSVPRDSFRTCLHWRARCQFPCLYLYIPISTTLRDFLQPCTQAFPPQAQSWCSGGSAAESWCWAALRDGSVVPSCVFRHCSWRLDLLVCRICSGAVFLRALREMREAASDVTLFNDAIYDGFFI